MFSKHIPFEVGMGDRVRFWTDQWCGDLPLHLSFPVVYGIAINREASVASSLERMGTEARRSWNVLLLRNSNNWESGDVDDFLHTLGANLPLSEQRDRMIWKLSKKGEFDVRSFSMISFDVLCLLFSFGKVFGRLRLRRMSLSLFGLQLGRRFL